MSAADSMRTIERPGVTVVIPTRNRQMHLRRLLQNLMLVIEPDLEVIVVNEASTDGTVDVIETFASRFSSLRWVTNASPLGLSTARNIGLELASRPLISWIDDDDLTSPDRFVQHIDAMQQTGCRWSFAGRVDIDDDLNITGQGRYRGSGPLLDELLSFNVVPAAGQGLLVQTDLAREIGGYDPTFHAAEDWDFCIRLANASPGVSIDAPLVGYRLVAGSMSGDPDRMDAAIASVVAKHEPLARQRGVSADMVRIDESLVLADLRTGSRRRALKRMCRILRARRTFTLAARCLLIALSPTQAARQSDRSRARVEAGWHREAESWLASVRAATKDPG